MILWENMAEFELGNEKTIEELTKRDYAYGRFLFRRDDFRFRLYLGEFNSHPDIVSRLELLKSDESSDEHIWGGGSFQIEDAILKFSGRSARYGSVPNSFLIDCCKKARIPNIKRFIFSLAPYLPDEPEIELIRKTWREIGNYEIDTDVREYHYNGDMGLIEVK